MNRKHLEKLLGMIIATTALGACGGSMWCNNEETTVIPVPDGGAGDWVAEACERECAGGISCEEVSIEAADGGAIPGIACTTEECSWGAGRRPLEPYGPEKTLAPDFATPGAWLVYAAELEAASVVAFRELRRDLAALGAPRRLLRAASRAAAEERRHTRQTRSLARRYGARMAALPAGASRRASLLELAAHNAAEGCVREAFGALVARWQATFARDPEVRSVMAQIAEDEARHAALAFAIDAWVKPRLDPSARARVEAARKEAARGLLAPRARDAGGEEAMRVLGVPDGAEAEALAKRFVAAIGLDAA
jgi:hypothetical protein